MTGRFTVAFGRRQPEAALRRRLDPFRNGESQPGLRSFDIGATPAWRFGSDDGVRYPPSFLADVPDTEAKLDWLKAEIARDLDVFARNPRRLLDLYFDFIRSRLDAEKEFLTEALKPLGGIFHVDDWAFSALRPMPNAAIFDADAAAPDAIIFHDLAFWTGERLLAIRLEGGATPSRAETEACDRLRAMGVGIIPLPARDLAQGVAVFAAERFPSAFRCFWQGVRYPCSPFRPQGLSETLSAI